MNQNQPINTDIVLVGGGHSHVAVLKRFGMRPLPGVRLTLIARDIETPYSGMLPGLVAGHYTHREAHIDLQRLARFAGARLVHASATGIDPERGVVLTDARPPVPYDYLSLDVGSTPSLDGIAGATANGIAVKPVDQFLSKFEAIEQTLTAAPRAPRIVLIGAGAGGVELALSMHHRLTPRLNTPAEWTIVTSASDIVPTHAPGVRMRLHDVLAERGINVKVESPVVALDTDCVRLESGESMPCDVAVIVTTATAPAWLADAGLALDERGFVRVGHTLQSISHPNVLAAGDVASFPSPLPKSGVFAVRQGPVLTTNLRRLALGHRPLPYKPQRQTLALISTGDTQAIASYGRLAWAGRWVWRWKDWIDRRWMQQYQVLPEMDAEGEDDEDESSHAFDMRCGGCGSKVSSAVLRRVLSRIETVSRDDVLVGLDGGDDAAVLDIPPGQVLVQSVDHFRPFVDDPYLFAQITANHCLSDLYAMGATPQSAQAMVTIPFGVERSVENDLFQLLSGAITTLNDANVSLVGGHTAEGPELVLGLTVNGFADPERLLSKGRIRPDDALVVTKPLGTGTVFAADMRAKASGEDIAAALDSMVQSNQRAAQIFSAHQVRACTDITGFGLLGHLVEMLNASGVSACLELASIPRLPGVDDYINEGFVSSLDPANRAFAGQIDDVESGDRALSILLDPQTSGGLLAAVPATFVEQCVQQLIAAGYEAACIIGQAESGESGRVRLT
ncbi:MAG: selenide, water dikinase SelD [Pseudomonadota bacterium]